MIMNYEKIVSSNTKPLINAMIVNYTVYVSRVADLKRKKILPKTAKPKKLVAIILPKSTIVAADIPLQPKNP